MYLWIVKHDCLPLLFDHVLPFVLTIIGIIVAHDIHDFDEPIVPTIDHYEPLCLSI